MASLSQRLKDNFFYLLELVRGTVSNYKNYEAKGAECEEETKAVSVTVKERGILKLDRGPTPPGVRKGPPPEHN